MGKKLSKLLFCCCQCYCFPMVLMLYLTFKIYIYFFNCFEILMFGALFHCGCVKTAYKKVNLNYFLAIIFISLYHCTQDNIAQ